jgi:hypothetical protein
MPYAALRKAERIGQPVGSKEWLADMEVGAGQCSLAPRRHDLAPRDGSPQLLVGVRHRLFQTGAENPLAPMAFLMVYNSCCMNFCIVYQYIMMK